MNRDNTICIFIFNQDRSVGWSHALCVWRGGGG